MTRTQRIERSLSVIIPIIIMIVSFVIVNEKGKNPLFDVNLLEGIETIKIVIGIWGTLLGFSIAAESILIAVNGSDLTKLMVSSGHLKTMLFSFMITNIVLFICLIMFIPIILGNIWDFYIFRLFICSITISFSSLGISLIYFFIMLSSVNK